MDQQLTLQGDKGINRDKLDFIPFSAFGAVGGIKGINIYKVYPLSLPRSASVWEAVR